MSEYEDSDFQSGEEVLEDDGPGEDTSDCERVCLGDQIPETATGSEDPPVTVSTLGGDRDILGDDDIPGPADSENEAAESDHLPPSLDSTPGFDPICSPFPPHSAQAYVPSTVNKQSLLALFKLLVSDQEFELFAANTNAYAESKNAIPKPSAVTTCRTTSSKRPWHPTNSKEIMTLFGLLIFMGLVKIPG